MRRSEIFENFVKIAQENGLVSKADHVEHTERDFSETNPRHDSLTIEQISKLYNTKPALPEGMEYKRNIIENAHPDSVVVSPSYDKLNGLVENENEGQNIRLRIVMKEPDGHLTNRKYAEKNLILSLVRVANELDNRDNDELRKLADVCLLQASSKKKITKNAWVAIAAGIAAAVGLLWLQQHKDFHSDGFTMDYQKAISEIDDLLSSNTGYGVWGYSYKPEFLQTLNQLKADLAKVNASAQKVIPLIQNVDKPRTKGQIAQELARIAQDPKTAQAEEAVKEFKAVVDEYGPEIYKVISSFYRQDYKNLVIADKGALTKAVDWTEILHGGSGLISDDFDDVRRALGTLWKDIRGIAGALRGAENLKQKLESEIQASQSQTAQMFGKPGETPKTPDAPEPLPGTQTAPTGGASKSQWDAIEEEAGGILGGGLGGLFGR